MDKTVEYHQGRNYYWHGLGNGCPYEEGTCAHADWWSGWEAAAREDSTRYKVADVPDEVCARCPQRWEGECRAFLMCHTAAEMEHRASGRMLCMEDPPPEQVEIVVVEVAEPMPDPDPIDEGDPGGNGSHG